MLLFHQRTTLKELKGRSKKLLDFETPFSNNISSKINSFFLIFWLPLAISILLACSLPSLKINPTYIAQKYKGESNLPFIGILPSYNQGTNRKKVTLLGVSRKGLNIQFKTKISFSGFLKHFIKLRTSHSKNSNLNLQLIKKREGQYSLHFKD